MHGRLEPGTERRLRALVLDEDDAAARTGGNAGNLICLPPEYAPDGRAVMLTAHLDSVAGSPGATDDGSGVAVLLETARALKSGAPLRNTVIFLFTDDEESGLVGAEAFIAHHPWAKEVKVVIGFDAGGLGGPGVLSATSEDNGWLIRQLAQADSFFAGAGYELA